MERFTVQKFNGLKLVVECQHLGKEAVDLLVIAGNHAGLTVRVLSEDREQCLIYNTDGSIDKAERGAYYGLGPFNVRFTFTALLAGDHARDFHQVTYTNAMHVIDTVNAFWSCNFSQVSDIKIHL